nr:MAG TPA: hypothetical protein [Caudoviricetes sp.]
MHTHCSYCISHYIRCCTKVSTRFVIIELFISISRALLPLPHVNS